MYPLTEAAESVDLHVMPVGVEMESTDYENPGSNPNSEPYPVTTTEFIAHGFEAEVCGCKVSARFKQPMSIVERRMRASCDATEAEWMNDNRSAFMDAVRHVWSGVDAHFLGRVA